MFWKRSENRDRRTKQQHNTTQKSNSMNKSNKIFDSVIFNTKQKIQFSFDEQDPTADIETKGKWGLAFVDVVRLYDDKELTLTKSILSKKADRVYSNLQLNLFNKCSRVFDMSTENYVFDRGVNIISATTLSYINRNLVIAKRLNNISLSNIALKNNYKKIAYSFIQGIKNSLGLISDDYDRNNETYRTISKFFKDDRELFDMFLKEINDLSINKMHYEVSIDFSIFYRGSVYNNLIREFTFNKNNIDIIKFIAGDNKLASKLIVSLLIFDLFNVYVKNKTNNITISILGVNERGSLELNEVSKQIHIDENIIPDENINIVKKISNAIEKNKNGIFILHGQPGTGKTTIIKYLILYENRRVAMKKRILNQTKDSINEEHFVKPIFIYIPFNLHKNIDSDRFISMLNKITDGGEYKPVIIIEDAEKILMSRETNKDSNIISSILNTSDGILSDFVSPIYIFTYNTDMNNIDNAVLRDKRNLGVFEIKPLCKKEIDRVISILKSYLDSDDKAKAFEEEARMVAEKNNNVLTIAELLSIYDKYE